MFPSQASLKEATLNDSNRTIQRLQLDNSFERFSKLNEKKTFSNLWFEAEAVISALLINLLLSDDVREELEVGRRRAQAYQTACPGRD